MINLLLSLLIGSGVSLVLIDLLREDPARAPSSLRQWARVARRPLLASAACGSAGATMAWAALAGPLPVLAGAAIAARLPASIRRSRRLRMHRVAADAWPRLLDTMRVSVGAGGAPLAHAFIDAGRTAPPPLSLAFAEAARSWRLNTDLDRALAVVRETAGDPTTRLVCDSLHVLIDVGPADLVRRLDRLADDRRRDADARKEADARLAGARFTRWFVLAAPVGLALVGQTIGSGRQAYATTTGQLAVLVSVALTAGCWVWAGRLLTVPLGPTGSFQ